MSIKNQVVAIVFLLILVMLGFSGYLVYTQQEKWIAKEAEWFALDKANTTAQYLYRLMERGEYEKKDKLLRAFSHQADVLWINVFRSPIIAAQYPESKTSAGAPRTDFEKRIFGSKEPIVHVDKADGVERLELIVPMAVEEGKCTECHDVDPGYVLGGVAVAVPLESFGADIRRDRKDILQVTLAFTVILLLFILSMLTRLIDTPIRKVVTIAEKIASGEIPKEELDIRAGGEIGRLVAAFTKMTDALSEVSSGAKVMAEGDLSKKIPQSGELADAFNGMVESLGHLVERIRYGSDTLGGAVDNIAAAAGEQSRGAEEQIREVEQMEGMMSAFSDSAATTAARSNNMFKIANHAFKRAREGRLTARHGQKAMTSIREGTDNISKHAHDMKEKTAQIGQVLELINNIAMETKILSVNASIEATKAGEYGKGFTVVAEEIAKLAENVVQATAAIQAINHEIQSFSGLLVGTVEESAQSVRHGVETMRALDKTLEEMLAAAAKTAAAAKKISGSMVDQKTKNQTVLLRMQLMTGRAKDLSRSAERSYSEADRIQRLSESLREDVAKFTIPGREDDDGMPKEIAPDPETGQWPQDDLQLDEEEDTGETKEA